MNQVTKILRLIYTKGPGHMDVFLSDLNSAPLKKSWPLYLFITGILVKVNATLFPFYINQKNITIELLKIVSDAAPGDNTHHRSEQMTHRSRVIIWKKGKKVK